MAGLQRSNETFRRSGSSGMVWDDKNISGEIIKPAGGDAAAAVERSRSTGHAHEGYRAAGRVPPAIDPPSPRVAVCGFCSFFGGGDGKGKTGGKTKAKGRRH
ncbi:hypothetical protein QOZ80_5BG0412710 [Eleusine coracana subsp. coracana]|nr:hypothetical protein QOZ80_5BG0412710 [Eleusine coracana subsp. coracana]